MTNFGSTCGSNTQVPDAGSKTKSTQSVCSPHSLQHSSLLETTRSVYPSAVSTRSSVLGSNVQLKCCLASLLRWARTFGGGGGDCGGIGGGGGGDGDATV
eukprot:6203781-Pleurochrysis_carterae.AAC.4